jgi:CheY-like chemotaxis protein
MKVLFIEDEAAATSGLLAVLRNAGHTADVAESIADAVSMLAHEQYDCVVLDLVLPDRTSMQPKAVDRDAGVFLLHRIRKSSVPAMKTDPKVPVVVVTAVSSRPTLDSLLDYPNVRVIQKPVDPEDVFRTVTVLVTARTS